MKIFISAIFISLFTCLAILITGPGCSGPSGTDKDSLAFASSPVLAPRAAIDKMHIEEGFLIRLVASEPLVTAPVAINFDKQGRIWVVQMNDYMPDTLGTGEEKPTGKIVILSDKDGDGIMDDRKV